MYQYGCDSWAFGGTGVPSVSLINVTKFFQEDGDYQHKKLPVINVQRNALLVFLLKISWFTSP